LTFCGVPYLQSFRLLRFSCSAAAGNPSMAWAAVSVTTDARTLAAAASMLEQQLCIGEHPWHTSSGRQAGRLGALQQRMGMVALDLRAAGQEQKLLVHEMRALIGSYEAEVAELQQAIAAVDTKISSMMQEQDASLSSCWLAAFLISSGMTSSAGSTA
jgi:hypothetical protein